MQIGIKKMFEGNNLEKLAEVTHFEPVVQPQIEEKETPEEEGKEPEKGEEIPEPEDPNKDRFLPAFVHWERCNTIADTLRVFEYVGSLLADYKFGLIIDDSSNEVLNGDVFDLTYGLGAGFLNMKGFQHSEKLAKVERFSELAGTLVKSEIIGESEGALERPETEEGDRKSVV